MINTLKKMMPMTPSVSGREQGICKIIADMMAPLTDEVRVDAMGNLICLKKGTKQDAENVMLCAHMDEIGFIVNFIEDNGYLRVAPIGGIHYVAAVFTEVVFENGVKGVFVPQADVTAKDGYKGDNCYIDIGAASKKEAERRVGIGDCCALTPHMTRLTANRIVGRPLDDRVGCACLYEIAKELTAPADNIYYVFSVQEEVGCRGAKTAAYAIGADLAIIYDVTGTGDEQGSKPMAVRLGEGTAVKIKDSSVICDRTLVDELLALAKEKKITAQCEILTYGGTDTSAVQMTGFGCRAGALSIPTRYIHSGVEMMDLRDVRATIELTVAYLSR